jgi:hypothetical protein
MGEGTASVAHFWDERVFIPDQSANAAALTSEFLANGGQPDCAEGQPCTRTGVNWVL